MSDKPDLSLEADDLSGDPMVQFRRWYEDAESDGIHLVNAIALATADAQGRPAVRHVLLRGFDDRGFVFYTNLESRKARHLAENPSAAFALLWKELDQQVCVTGSVERTTDAESDAYFDSRPREARIGAWASRQSEVLSSRDVLMSRFIEIDARYPGDDVPRPPFWGGYRIVPDTVEFWQARAFRLHDRFRYSLDEDEASGWRVERLSP
ncbi:MAG: pyridoxamine 5'-phosphate oxidase [Actinomycetota bacterium]